MSEASDIQAVWVEEDEWHEMYDPDWCPSFGMIEIEIDGKMVWVPDAR